jgi:hypothetical protein
MSYDMTVKKLKVILDRYQDDVKIMCGCVTDAGEDAFMLSEDCSLEFRDPEMNEVYPDEHSIPPGAGKMESVLVIWQVE